MDPTVRDPTWNARCLTKRQKVLKKILGIGAKGMR